MITKREDVREFEIVSLDGRDLVTVIINGVAFDMSTNVATVLSKDIAKAVKRAKGTK